MALRPREALPRLPETAPMAEGRGQTAEGGFRASTSSKMASFRTYVSPAQRSRTAPHPHAPFSTNSTWQGCALQTPSSGDQL